MCGVRRRTVQMSARFTDIATRRRNDDGGDESRLWEALTHGIILDHTFILRDLISYCEEAEFISRFVN